MSEQIWKFPLAITSYQEVRMPVWAKILTVQTQDNIPCLWAIVEPDNSLVARPIYMFGTGHDMPNMALTHIGTIQTPPYVWHYFEPTRN